MTKIPVPSVAFVAQPNVDEEWARFSSNLALVLADLEEDEYLIISVKKTGLFVQFAAQGQFGMRAEAASNNYPKDKTMPQDVCVVMRDLGWNAQPICRRNPIRKDILQMVHRTSLLMLPRQSRTRRSPRLRL